MTEFEKQDQNEYREVPQNDTPVPQQNEAQEPQWNEPQEPEQWNQNPGPWDHGQFQNEPQNDGPWNQNQNPWNNGQFQNGPQNHGPWNQNQNPNPWNNRQFQNEPQNHGSWNQHQRPYQNPYNPYKRNPKKNGFATSALISGVFAILNLCCFSFPSAIIMGVGAICIAIISKRDEPFRKSAITAIVLGVIAIAGGVAEFFYSLWLSDLMRDPANIEMFNQLFEQFEKEMGVPIQNMLP